VLRLSLATALMEILAQEALIALVHLIGDFAIKSPDFGAVVFYATIAIIVAFSVNLLKRAKKITIVLDLEGGAE
jgi:hypothetical protein